ncbi:hypothetical protein BDU57DRAFT_519696 [Ampelomyces quisqualis]|uniref:Uncharacterized protein n=1 Tax=Ampelomyces quisqualis TaxID=50730 RepID=A0A6A5QGT1_AMPQU|nr:hypothetical protein BDU57DRAFT_519696 [Ampelomyces quisqualis]
MIDPRLQRVLTCMQHAPAMGGHCSVVVQTKESYKREMGRVSRGQIVHITIGVHALFAHVLICPWAVCSRRNVIVAGG